MKAAILLIGTELLNGLTLDTNSIYISEELNKIGIEVKYKLLVRDFVNEILDALNFLENKVDLIIASGGLGPTDDDVTKEAISRYFNEEFIVEQKDIEIFENKKKKYNFNLILNNYKEISKPVNSITFENDFGMAPAIYFKNIVLFPGVPRELKNMFPKFLEYYKAEQKLSDEIYIKDILTYGLGESTLENTVKDLFDDENIFYEFLVKDYATIIRMQTVLSEKKSVEKIKRKLYNRIHDYIFGEDDDRLENIIFKKLYTNNLTLSVAESCTGGKISSKLVSLPGISKVFKEGIVTYSNESKIDKLSVQKETLIAYGAVSEEVAREMVLGLKTDVGISTTGIAGPDGGTDDKPIGLVYVGIKIKNKVKIYKKIINGNRETVRERASVYALFMLLKNLKEEYDL